MYVHLFHHESIISSLFPVHLQKNTESAIVQQLVTTVLRTDKDSDLKIGPAELKKLMLRLESFETFSFNQAKFKEIIGEGEVPVEKIMKVIRNLKAGDDLPEGEKVFTIIARASLTGKKGRRN